MIHTPDYQILLPDGSNVPLLFKTWAFKKFCSVYEMEFEDFLSRLRREDEEKKESKPLIKYSEYPNFFLCAAECWCKYNNKDFTYNELDACDWLDQIGGYTSKILVDITIIALSKLMNQDPERIKAASTIKQKENGKKKASKD